MLGRGLAMSVPSGWDGLPTSRLSLLDGKGEQVKQGRESSAQSTPWGTTTRPCRALSPGMPGPVRLECLPTSPRPPCNPIMVLVGRWLPTR